jgi:hypothetical protein
MVLTGFLTIWWCSGLNQIQLVRCHPQSPRSHFFEAHTPGLQQLFTGTNKAIHGSGYVYLDRSRIGKTFFTIPVAAGENNAVATFYSSDKDPGTSSLFKPDGSNPTISFGAEFNVPVLRLSYWFEKFPFGQNGVEYIEHVKVKMTFDFKSCFCDDAI